MVCKICGKKIPSPEKYMRPESTTTICNDHVEYCHKKCGIASSVKGWHYEPCTSCEHNPYNNKMCNQDCLNCEKEYCTAVYREKSLYRYRPESQKQYQKDYQKRKRDEAREKGLCIVCRKKKATKGAKCYECYLRQKRYDKSKYRNDRERWKEEGRCYYCGEKVIPGKKTCKKHYAALSQRAAEMNEHKRTINARRKNKIERGRRSD